MSAVDVLALMVGVGIGAVGLFIWERTTSAGRGERKVEKAREDKVWAYESLAPGEELVHFQTDWSGIDVSWKKVQKLARREGFAWRPVDRGARAVLAAAKPGDVVALTIDQKFQIAAEIRDWLFEDGHDVVGCRLLSLRYTLEFDVWGHPGGWSTEE